MALTASSWNQFSNFALLRVLVLGSQSGFTNLTETLQCRVTLNSSFHDDLKIEIAMLRSMYGN